MRRRIAAPAGPTPSAAVLTFHVPPGDADDVADAHEAWCQARQLHRDAHGWPDNQLTFLRENFNSHRAVHGWRTSDPYAGVPFRERPPLVVWPDGRRWPDGEL